MLNCNDTLVILIDLQEKFIPVMYNKEDLVYNSMKFFEGIKILDVPVLVTQQYTKGLGMTIQEIKSIIGDKYIDKITFDCCGNEEFLKVLNQYNKQNILLCGIEAHICVKQTAMSLLNIGKQVYLVEDCISSRKEHNKSIAIYQLSKDGANITTYEAVLFELLGKAGGNKFKQISKLVK